MRGLQSELSAEIDVIFINIHDTIGAAVLDRFDFVSSPLYLLFDADGNEALRTSAVPTVTVIRASAF